MERPRVALFNFLEGHQREDVYQKRHPVALREIERLTKALTTCVDLIALPHAEVRSKKEVRENVQASRCLAADAAVLHVPVFVPPALVAHAARLLDSPLALVANEAQDTVAQLALLASGGAIDQAGIPCRRIAGGVEDVANLHELTAYLRAAAAVMRLKGMTFGVIGGRSLGISTGVADPAMWQRKFAVDIEHVDQSEIVLRAEKVPPADVERHAKWLTDNLGGFDYRGGAFTEAHLARQLRSYIATKEIVVQYELDFIGIKCQPEMSNGYVLQCLNVALMNDPYDAEGEKEPIACSCEADSDGALTMQMLKLVSGGGPTFLGDIVSITAKGMVLANCGAGATWFAGCSESAQANMRQVRMVPNSFGSAGGGTTQFIGCPGPVTLARLSRREGAYRLSVVVGSLEVRDRESVAEAFWPRPLFFVRAWIDKRRFLARFGANHILGVKGEYVSELRAMCEILDIEYECYNEVSEPAGDPCA